MKKKRQRGPRGRLHWHEPVRFARRDTWRWVMKKRQLLLRCMVYGPVLAILGHLGLAWFDQPLPTHWVRWYGSASLAIPTLFGSILITGAFLPRLISLTPRHVVLHNILTNQAIFGRQIRGWSFRTLPNDVSQTVVRLRYVDAEQRPRAATFALARRIERTEVDHLLRVIARLAQ